MTLKLGRAICTLALVCSTQGHATITASAHLSGLTFSFTDLRPDDGAAPSLSFVGGRSFLLGVADFRGLPGKDARLWGTGPFADLDANITVGTVHTSAFVDEGGGGEPWSGAVLYAEGSIGDAANRDRAFSSSVLSHSSPSSVVTMFLSPFTQLEVKITAVLSASKTAGASVNGGGGEVSVARAGLALRGPGFDNGRSASIYLATYDPAQSQSRTTTVSAYARNTTNQPMALYFYAHASVDGRSTVSVVPEPAAWSLWVAGLGGMAWRLRRRARPQSGQEPVGLWVGPAQSPTGS